jgi:hypothetical protein
LNELLGAERNQHADDNDADLADEGAPSVQRLWQTEVNGKRPPRRDTPVRAQWLTSATDGKRTHDG